MKKLWYPSVDDVKEANKIAIDNFRATKAERHEVYSHNKIKKTIVSCKRKKGNNEQKAVCLLKKVSSNHPFASANRRTGYLVMNEFLWKNSGYLIAKKKTFTSQLFKELRRRDVPEDEILSWYKKNKKYI